MNRVFIADANYKHRLIDGFVDQEVVELVPVEKVTETGESVVVNEERKTTIKEPAKVPNPDYVPTWICVNVDNDEDAQAFIDQGAKELTTEEIIEAFGSEEMVVWASPSNTVVSPDGQKVESFTPPNIGPTKAELEERVRTKRDSLIEETDYLLMSDYPISAEELVTVKTYRQALRDVPQQPGFPQEIQWPNKPSVQKRT